LLALAAVLSWAVRRDSPPFPAGALALCDSASVALAAVLLLPALPGGAPAWRLLVWGLLAILSTGMLAAWHGPAPLLPALGVGLLVGLLGGLGACWAVWLDSPVGARLGIWGLTGLVTAAPLWLGPLAERFAAWPGVVDTVVAVSPLSYLAALAAEDYLHYDWFYQHTPVGGLPYAYPSAALWSAGCAALAGLCLWAIHRRLARTARPAARQSDPGHPG
jgi:hypothetical protein